MKFDLDAGLVPIADESIESLRFVGRGSEGVSGTIEGLEGFPAAVGLGWYDFHKSRVNSNMSAPIAANAAE